VELVDSSVRRGATDWFLGSLDRFNIDQFDIGISIYLAQCSGHGAMNNNASGSYIIWLQRCTIHITISTSSYMM